MTGELFFDKIIKLNVVKKKLNGGFFMIIEIKVVPRAGKVGFTRDKSGAIKCFLKSPPEKGKANQELLTLLATTLRLPQSSIRLITGFESRQKKIELITSLSYEEVVQKLGIATGQLRLC